MSNKPAEQLKQLLHTLCLDLTNTKCDQCDVISCLETSLSTLANFGRKSVCCFFFRCCFHISPNLARNYFEAIDLCLYIKSVIKLHCHLGSVGKGWLLLINHHPTCREFINVSALPLCLSFPTCSHLKPAEADKNVCQKEMCAMVDLEGRPLSTSCDSIDTVDSSLGLQCLDGLDARVSAGFCFGMKGTT